MDSTILASIVGAVATVVASIVTFYSTRRTAPKQPVVEVLPDRVAVFCRARKLIDEAKHSVIDTTWGNSEENLLPVEHEALDDYLRTKTRVIRNSKIDYREIYTNGGDDTHRSTRIDNERTRQERLGKYSAKLLEGLAPSFPMMDFLVIDGRKVILSCLSKDIARPDHHHLYLESTQLALFLTQYFQICWDRARLLAAASPCDESDLQKVQVDHLIERPAR